MKLFLPEVMMKLQIRRGRCGLTHGANDVRARKQTRKTCNLKEMIKTSDMIRLYLGRDGNVAD